MALSASTAWEYRSNGGANNGGGFVTGASGTDYSQQDSAQITRTDIVIDATTNTDITSAATPYTTAEIGNLLNITSGTGFTTGRYEITAVDGSNIATLDRAVGTVSSTGGNGTMGGAVTLLDANLEEAVAGNILHVKADATHTLSAAISVVKDGSATAPIILEGYNTTRGDQPTGTNRPLIAAGANAVSFDNYWRIKNFRMTSTAALALRADFKSYFFNCKVENTRGTAGGYSFYNQTDGSIFYCEAETTNGNGLILWAGVAYGCYIHDSSTGLIIGGGDVANIINCVFDTITNDAIDLGNGGRDGVIIGNTIYNCGKGVDVSSTYDPYCIINNIFDNCTTGVDLGAADETIFMDYNNYNGNTTDVNNIIKGDNATALSPGFTDAANGDFTVGTNMKATAMPPDFGGLTSNFLDQGAAQREEPAGGGGTIARFVGV